MADLSIISGYIMKYAVNPLMWLILMVGIVTAMIGVLYIRKRRALKYDGFEITDYGFNTGLKCGWFGSKWYLKGLWTSGNELMFTSTGEEILKFSEEDFIELNGKRGVPFIRDPISRRLYPAKAQIDKNAKLVMFTVPPRSYIDAAVDIFNETVKETADWKEKIIQFIAWALVVVFSLIAIIVIVQYVKSAQDKAADLLVMAGTKSQESCREILRSAITIVASNTPAAGAP